MASMRTILLFVLLTISATVSAAPIDPGAAYAAIAGAEGLQELSEALLLKSGSAASPGVFEFNPAE
ncbi:hypothetical protein BJ138DRAFT_1112038 [Hygrophoropsis aurantiaca]|uniref:Uncharacterized protein n=1 Tax=Hygrophoropsis aurantiaca TaxID=72124 RepID=A0ACB8AGR4_9AGAM|nr:hypothetical protein BJ138DRAFT_1112038 [Hygrophoropsis aurantiaca]